MGSFAAIISRSEQDPEIDRLLGEIEMSSPTAREEALASLIARAEQTSHADDWNAVGVAYHSAGLHPQATNIFNALVEQYPDFDLYRLNLATSLSQLSHVEACRYQLQYLAKHASTDEYRQLGKEQLEGYEKFLGLTDEDLKLRELQIESLRQRIEESQPQVEDFANLAKMLTQSSFLLGDQNLGNEAMSVLESGLRVHPNSVPLLELLIASYLRHDPNDRLDGALKKLERLAPESQVLSILSNIDDDQGAEFSQNLYQRGNDLLSKITQVGEQERPAILSELQRVAASYPDNSGYRLQYAFALMSVDEKEKALEQAAILAASNNRTHSHHFNLGQIFWICGDAKRGRQHLELSVEYAENDQEREDALERIAELGK